MSKTLQIEPISNGFALTITEANGDVMRVELSEDNVLTLATLSLSLKDQLLAKHSRTQMPAKSVLPVAQILLNSDIHLTEVHLELIDRHETSAIFALSQGQAQSLVDYLPKWIAKLTQPKTKQ